MILPQFRERERKTVNHFIRNKLMQYNSLYFLTYNLPPLPTAFGQIESRSHELWLLSSLHCGAFSQLHVAYWDSGKVRNLKSYVWWYMSIIYILGWWTYDVFRYYCEIKLKKTIRKSIHSFINLPNHWYVVCREVSFLKLSIATIN